MTVIAHKTQHIGSDAFRVIMTLSAWGFGLVLSSFLFLWLGHLLDELLGTTPKLMLSLFILAIIGCFIEIYQQALHIINNK
jgi:hypothetical protein